MKILNKSNIIRRNQVEHTKTERRVLGYTRHPNVVGLHYAFQSRKKLYFVLDYCAGGELFFHLGRMGRFECVQFSLCLSATTLPCTHLVTFCCFDCAINEQREDDLLLHCTIGVGAWPSALLQGCVP